MSQKSKEKTKNSDDVAKSNNLAKTLSNLNAQKILALQAGKTKAAALIQVIIDRLSKK